MKGLAETAESQKLRHIFCLPIDCLPEDQQRNVEQIPWHFDQVLCSVLYKDRFFERDGDNFKEVPRPIDCGL
jgi:hypothetical protein